MLQIYIKFYILPNVLAKKYQKIYIFMVFDSVFGENRRKITTDNLPMVTIQLTLTF